MSNVRLLMNNIEFHVDRIESNGLFIGHNGRVNVPLGTVFTAIYKSRVDGEPPDLLTVEIGVIGRILLTLKEVHMWRTTVPEIPFGHSAGLRLEGDGLDALKEALKQKKDREYVHIRA
jgi:hypothetical protein